MTPAESGLEGGMLWLIIDVLLVAVLGAAIAYGIMMWRRRRGPVATAARDAATDRLYHESEEQADREARRQTR